MLETIVNTLAYGSLLFAACAAYLQLNKLWSRKHLPEVAESISIPGILVESIPLFFFALYFMFKGEVLGIIDSVIWLISAVLVTMIGSGFWVKGQRKRGMLRLMLGAITRERAEIGQLAREFVSPSSAPQLIRVLTSVAAVDGDIDQREIQLVQTFADEWNLSIDWHKLQPTGSSSGRIMESHSALMAYMETSPPAAQVSRLLELLQLLIDADDNRSDEEQMAFDEMNGVICQYLNGDSADQKFTVVIVPQNDQQDEAIRLLLESVEPQAYAGGNGYTAGSYFSPSFAEIICNEYRALGFFTVFLDPDQLAER